MGVRVQWPLEFDFGAIFGDWIGVSRDAVGFML